MSATSSALDSAQGQSAAVENSSTNGWGSIHRHRAQQSLSTIGSAQLANNSTIGSGPASDVSTIGTRTPRHSIDLQGYQVAPPGASELSGATTAVSPPSANHANMMATPPKLQQSYSANEVPTLKGNNGASAMSPMSANANNHAQQHFHNHNLNSGRYPAGAQPNNRHSREMSNETNSMATSRDAPAYGSINSTLHASAAPFGPVNPQAAQPGAMNGGAVAPYAPNPYQYYQPQVNYNGAVNGAGYGGPQNGMGANNMNYPSALTMGMQGLNMNGSMNGNAGQPMYQPPQGYQGYNQNQMYGSQVARAGPQDSQARVIQTRRAMDNEGKFFFEMLPTISRQHN